MARPKGSKNKPSKKAPKAKVLSDSTTEVKDTEQELLCVVCNVFDGFDENQKRRSLAYLSSKYFDYLPNTIKP